MKATIKIFTYSIALFPAIPYTFGMLYFASNNDFNGFLYFTSFAWILGIPFIPLATKVNEILEKRYLAKSK